MKHSSPTEVGLTDTRKADSAPEEHSREERIDAINQVFALFRLNFHAQFFKAFSTDSELSQVKKLWFGELDRFAPNVLLKAAKVVIESSDFLPTLHTMIRHCEALSNSALPDAHSAYIEACRAPSPKAQYRWSHPIVYQAGKACDWYFLQTSSENTAYPIFRKKYQEFVDRTNAGERFELPAHNAIEEKTGEPLSKTENKERLQSLREALNL